MAEIPPYTPQLPPPPPPPPPPPRVLTDSWGVCRIRTGCSRPPVALGCCSPSEAWAEDVVTRVLRRSKSTRPFGSRHPVTTASDHCGRVGGPDGAREWAPGQRRCDVRLRLTMGRPKDHMRCFGRRGGRGGTRGRPAVRGKGACGGRAAQRVEEQGTWASRTRKHSEAGYGRPVDRGVWTANTVKRPRQQPAHPQYANYWAPLTRKRHITPDPATSSTAPAHQQLGSANAETTPAGAPAAAADRKQRPDATCEGKNG